MMETLWSIYQRHRVNDPSSGCGDKGSTHSYISEYSRLLAPFRSGCTLMEIGLALGHSIGMWREYMPAATIIGVDHKIMFDRAKHEASGTILIESDATKPEFLVALGNRTLDVVIDDASHMTDDQIATFNLLRSRINLGGIYIIEDILALEIEKKRYAALHPNLEIVDNRSIKGRFDDILLVYSF